MPRSSSRPATAFSCLARVMSAYHCASVEARAGMLIVDAAYPLQALIASPSESHDPISQNFPQEFRTPLQGEDRYRGRNYLGDCTVWMVGDYGLLQVAARGTRSRRQSTHRYGRQLTDADERAGLEMGFSSGRDYRTPRSLRNPGVEDAQNMPARASVAELGAKPIPLVTITLPLKVIAWMGLSTVISGDSSSKDSH